MLPERAPERTRYLYAPGNVAKYRNSILQAAQLLNPLRVLNRALPIHLGGLRDRHHHRAGAGRAGARILRHPLHHLELT